MAGIDIFTTGIQRLFADIPDSSRPNVLLMLIDDLGYGDLGIHGCKDIPTPNIDTLARSGVRFTNGYVSGAQCLPSRVGLNSGMYQQRFGITSNNSGLIANLYGSSWHGVSLGKMMKKSGYDCLGLGKLQATHGAFGLEDWTKEYGPIDNTIELAEKAAAFIKKDKTKPFFIYFSPRSPHVPLSPKKESLRLFESIPRELRRKYAATVHELDQAVGMMMKALSDSGQSRNTLIFFISDNGGPMEKKGPNGSENGPLRGQKKELFEGGIRVPFFMAWEGVIPAGSTYDHPVICLDVLPTCAALAKAKLPEGYQSDGVNLLPYLMGEQTGIPHEYLFWLQGSLKSTQYAVRKGDWKLLVQEGRTMLFNLADDLGETTDRSRDESKRLPELADELVKWVDQLAPSIPRWPGLNGGGGKKEK
ncbi:MAG: sulfatase family protein [Planctomycetota bacterium]|jgi:arylsulfatase A-like enzyme